MKIKTKAPPVVMVGAFPPPMHGMAAVNAAVRDALRAAQVEPLVIDVAAPSLERSLSARLGRLPRVGKGLLKLATRRRLRGASLYMSVSGGFGQMYEIVFVLLARLRGMRIFLHHHSFAYLDRPNGVTSVLMRATGAEAIHIALSSGMAERLKSSYGVGGVTPISNAVFFATTDAAGTPRKEPKTLGFVSNIALEKGVFGFLDLMKAAQTAGLPVRGKLAGPFQDADTERAVRARLRELPLVEYAGPRYGADKVAFFDGIDVLIFPTRYANEAEPVTIHEAMSRAVPVIAYGRGCIPEIVDPRCGLVIDPEQAFVPAALEQLEHWMADSAAFQAASKAAAARFASNYAENEMRWQTLLAKIIGATGAWPRDETVTP